MGITRSVKGIISRASSTESTEVNLSLHHFQKYYVKLKFLYFTLPGIREHYLVIRLKSFCFSKIFIILLT